MADFLEALAHQQLKSLDAGVRLIVVHPQYTRQHLLLDHFLNQPNAVYVRLDTSLREPKQIDEHLSAVLTEQIAQASLEGVTTLVIDECDRVDAALFTAFLMNTFKAYPNLRIVMFAREVPQVVLSSQEINEQTVFLPVSDPLMLKDYRGQCGTSPLLEVRALGAGQVVVNGRSITNWDGILPRSLFFYLVDRGMATRSEIFETFWPRLTTREATNVFHVTKRKINEVIGLDLTVYWSGYYRISPDIDLSYDTMAFIEMVHTGDIAEESEAERLLGHAMALYRGHYLSTVDMPWAVQRRQEIAQIYGDALTVLARIHENREEYANALGLYMRALSCNRQREDLVENTMRLCEMLEMPVEGLAAYRGLEDALEEVQIRPPIRLREMADSLKQQANSNRQLI